MFRLNNNQFLNKKEGCLCRPTCIIKIEKNRNKQIQISLLKHPMSKPKSLKINLARLRKLFYEVDEKEIDGEFHEKADFKHFMENIFIKTVKEYHLDFEFTNYLNIEGSLIIEYKELLERLHTMENIYREAITPKSVYQGRLLLFGESHGPENYTLIDIESDKPNSKLKEIDKTKIGFELRNDYKFRNSAKIEKLLIQHFINWTDYIYVDSNLKISITNRTFVKTFDTILFVVPLNLTRKLTRNNIRNWMAVYRQHLLEFTGITNDGKIIILKSLYILTYHLVRPILFGDYLINIYPTYIDLINIVTMARTYGEIKNTHDSSIKHAYYYPPSIDSRSKFINLVYRTLETFPRVLVEILADYSW
ncbi:MAG: hypothetical protein Hyperionvirus3_39 [Hyperionvirus sp.]|uniref:Uncharacterized protein n=1 Tax=Hyperionvirus sp. TaxID=2487770 RepID=A0A3G5AAN5_9VIRU|nr:MAG: hypothetical protein Hyperionvirus3_39 [Hyperionvirus sp.]